MSSLCVKKSLSVVLSRLKVKIGNSTFLFFAEWFCFTDFNMRHIISVLVENEAGALTRVAGLFSVRGYNIDSLTVAPTHDPTLSRMTVVSSGNDTAIEQIISQLMKLVDVVSAVDITSGYHLERELLLVKLSVEKSEQKSEAQRLSEIFRGRILDVSPTTYTIEVTGSGDKLDAFLGLLDRADIVEVVRSGVIAFGRGMELVLKDDSVPTTTH